MIRMAEPTGFEPATSDVTGRRSNQLNYDSAFFRSEISNLKSEIFHYWWARRDSNPQPLPCKGSRLPLTYVPVFKNPSATDASRRSVIVRKASMGVKKRDRSSRVSKGAVCLREALRDPRPRPSLTVGLLTHTALV